MVCYFELIPLLQMIFHWFHTHSNVDWGGDIADRRSISGHYLLLNGNPIVWSSKTQSLVLRSSAKAEFRGVANVVCEIVWVKSLLKEIGLQWLYVSVVLIDNTSVVPLSENLIQYSKMKNVEIYLFFVREKVLSVDIIVNIVPATEQTTYILTIPLTEKCFVPCRRKLGVFSIEEVQDFMIS